MAEPDKSIKIPEYLPVVGETCTLSRILQQPTKHLLLLSDSSSSQESILRRSRTRIMSLLKLCLPWDPGNYPFLKLDFPMSWLSSRPTEIACFNVKRQHLAKFTKSVTAATPKTASAQSKLA